MSSQPPSGVLDPKNPWYTAKVGERTWKLLKAKLTGNKMDDGTQYSSFVNLSEEDADKLIDNMKKDPRGYPQFNNTGGAQEYENLQKYQEWLVESYLKDQEKIDKAKAFISGATSFRPGKTISLKTTRMAGIVPKRTIPQEIATKITPQQEAETATTESAVAVDTKITSSLGRLTLDLVQIGDNLDKIKEVIEEDYKQTKEVNRKEVEDYRKRIANRGRKLPKKDLGDNKRDLGSIIKPFVSGFFSGAGGAIRSLGAFKLIEALLNGDYVKVFKSLLGIGITFIPQIATMIAGAIIKSIFKGLGRRAFGGGFGGPRIPSPRMRSGRVGRVGKFGGALALGAGALSLGSAYMASQQDDQSDQETSQDPQTRLEQVTQEQKSLTDKGLVSITQTDLKKFQDLNKKFEKTLDILIQKSGAGIGTSGDLTNKSPENLQPGTAPMGGDIGQVSSAVENPNVKAFLDTLANVESGGKYNVSVGGATFSDMSKHPEMYNPAAGSDAAGRYQFISTTYKPIAQKLGLKDFSARSQDLAAVQYLKDLGVLDEIMKGDKSSIEDVIRRLRGSTWTGLRRYGSGQGFEFFQQRKQVYGTQSNAAPAPPRRNADQVSAAPSNGRSIAVVPVPSMTGNNSPGSFNPPGSSELASVNPSNSNDVYGRLNRTAWNVVDVG